MVKFCSSLSKIVGKISFAFSIICATAIAFIAIISSIDSIGRYILGSALRGASEYVETAMSVFVYGGLAFAVRIRRCVTVPVITDALKPRLRLFVIGIGNLVCCAAAVLVSTQMFLRAVATMSNLYYTTEVVGIPYGPFYLFSFIGMCLIAIELLVIGVHDLYEAIFWKRYAQEHPRLSPEGDGEAEEVEQP